MVGEAQNLARLGNSNTAWWFPFLYPNGKATVIPTDWGRDSRSASCGGHTRLDNGRLVRSRRRDRGRGKKDDRATLQHRTIVALKEWGPTVGRIDRDGEIVTRRI
jgi:hypothetical protein